MFGTVTNSDLNHSTSEVPGALAQPAVSRR